MPFKEKVLFDTLVDDKFLKIDISYAVSSRRAV
jgi:hypothetical protein